MVRSARHQANSERTRLNVCMLNSYCFRVRGAVGALGVALKVPETVTARVSSSMSSARKPSACISKLPEIRSTDEEVTVIVPLLIRNTPVGWLGSPVQPITLMKLIGVAVMIGGVSLATFSK